MQRVHVLAVGLLGAVALAVAGILVLGSHGGGGSPARAQSPSVQATVEGQTFHTPVPAGWKVVASRSAKGARGFHLSSTGAEIDGLGIGPAGTAGLTVAESNATVLSQAKIAGRPLGSLSPAKIFPHIIGQPAGATGVVTTEAATPARLDGAPAAEEAFSYTYQGRHILQVDVLALHGGRLFTIELDTEPSLAEASSAGLVALSSGWHWD